MAELIKQWNDGGSLSVTYDGDGDGSAIFSSDQYEGIDRVQSVVFRDGENAIAVERTVRQEGIRQQFVTSDGKVFRVTQGRFGVLKDGVEPPTPPVVETYTRLTYIECTGEQYIDLGYVVQEDDVIEMNFIRTSETAVDKALFGVSDGVNGLWCSLYGSSAYYRFGTAYSDNYSGASKKYHITLKKGLVDIDGLSESIGFVAMPTANLYLFARNSASTNAATMYGYCRSNNFSIKKLDGTIVMHLKSCKRDSDGAIGMLDSVSGQFFTNKGTGADFIAGNEIKVPQGYEVIDYVTFSKNKRYDLGIVSSTDKIEVMFARNETTSTNYMYGVITDPHTASVTAYLSSGGAWRFGSSYKGINMNNKNIHRVEIYNGNIIYDFTQGTFSKSTFTTPNTAVLGGYRSASGSLSNTYQGKIYYFRIYNNNELRLDWYPCKRLSDEVEGFWDCVTQSFIEPL